MKSTNVQFRMRSSTRLVRRRAFFVSLIFASLLALSLWDSSAIACTLWAAAGDRVSGGGTLIAKNRDALLEGKQSLKLISPANGHRFYALVHEGKHGNDVKAGINEKGLAVVSASPPYDAEYRRSLPRTKKLNYKILANCSSVQEALSHRDWFLGPRFLIISDATHIALVAIGPHGEVAISSRRKGVLYHTNHYVAESLKALNPERISPSSRARFKTVKEFMTTPRQFDLDDFVAFSELRNNGPSKSIWRVGKTPESSRTVATWILMQQPAVPPQLYVKMVDLQGASKVYNVNVDDIFKQ